MNGILLAFIGTLFTFSVTTLGAMNVFFIKKDITDSLQSIFLGFAGGVMIAASVWSLLLPGIQRAEEENQIGWLVMTLGFLGGVCLLLVADRCVKSRYEKMLAKGNLNSLRRSTSMLILAITIHNIPEGMAVGLAFALAMSQPEDPSLFSGAIALALGIGIQNYPEGTAVSLPLLREGVSKRRSFLIGSMSAVVEPIFGVLAAILTTLIVWWMPFLLAFAAGTMIYVVVEELLPEARMCSREKNGSLGFIAGFLIMMILDVSLG